MSLIGRFRQLRRWDRMRHSFRHHVPAPLPEAIQRQLNMYALAASAGVGFLVLLPSSEAKIIYTTAHLRVEANTFYPLDLNHDGVPDFVLSNRHRTTNTLYWGYLSALPIKRNGVEGISTRSGFGAYALKRGAIVGPKRPFVIQKMAEVRIEDSTFYYYGKWVNVTNRYLGLKFNIAGKTHYGWARLSTVFDSKARMTATLTGYAYETNPNKSIVAGKTSGPNLVVEPATLGRLALGRK